MQNCNWHQLSHFSIAFRNFRLLKSHTHIIPYVLMSALQYFSVIALSGKEASDLCLLSRMLYTQGTKIIIA